MQLLCLEFFGFFGSAAVQYFFGSHIPPAIVAAPVFGLEQAAGREGEGQRREDE